MTSSCHIRVYLSFWSTLNKKRSPNVGSLIPILIARLHDILTVGMLNLWIQPDCLGYAKNIYQLRRSARNFRCLWIIQYYILLTLLQSLMNFSIISNFMTFYILYFLHRTILRISQHYVGIVLFVHPVLHYLDWPINIDIAHYTHKLF